MVADPPYRVAYVIGELGKGGAEYQLYELLRHLDRRRFAPGVFVLAPGGWWVEPIRALGVPVEEIPRRGPADVRRLTRLRASLRRFAPHLLHAILWSGNSYGRLAALGLGIPVVIAAEFPDVDFLVVGEGGERAALEALARRLGLGARVVFTGLRHDVPRLLAAVDVLALTSLYEGFPNVLLEAMATGAVAVATDVGGCRELVTSGETGLLVPPRAPAALAAAGGAGVGGPPPGRPPAT